MSVSTNSTIGGGNSTASLPAMVLARKAELEAQLRALETLDIENLLRERAETAARLTELDEKIARVRAQLGLGENAEPTRGVPRPVGSAVRTRLSGQEIRNRIVKALSEEKFGLSQLQIAERTAVAYGTVAAYLKANAGLFKTTGQLKGKRYFLK